MDIKDLEKFFDYVPFLNQDTQIILDKIISETKKYLPADQIPLIQKAYDYAKEKHKWQVRLSWEEYIVHPLRATEFLIELKPDLETIQTCILHDVIEDCNVSESEIEKLFWTEVANLCEGMVKVSKIKYKWEDRHLETLKKTFLAMAKDLRVIFIKLADRIHNIQTLQYHPNPIKRQKIANETMKIFVPIAKRLWLFHYQLYLENGAFKVANTEQFEKIFWYLRKFFGEWEKYTEKWIKIISNFLQQEWITDFVVKWRIKSPYRVYEKIEKRYQSQELNNVMDLLAFRIITKTMNDCYLILGIIHKNYTPLIKKIKDYIAVPKFNWYQSIHTTILGMFNVPVEIQIRTYEMDEVAEYWIAAHFAYSEYAGPVKIPEQQSQWIKKLQEIVNEYQSTDEKEQFKKELNIEILDKRIYIFTPNWDVKELPTWSTVLDFAFSIHSDIWLKFKNAIVNWEIKPISYTPKIWDIVKIQIFKNKYSANKHWFEFLHTTWAKANLLKFLKIEQKDNLIKLSESELNKNLEKFWLPWLWTEKDQISKIYKKEEMDKKLLNIIDKKNTYNQLIKSAYPKQRDSLKKINKIPAPKKIIKEEIEIIIDSDKSLNYKLCKECSPKAWDKIIAKTWKDWIRIHALNCKSLKTISFDKLLEAHRKWEKTNSYNAIVELKIFNKYWNLLKIISILSDLHIPINKIEMINNWDLTSSINFESEFENPAKFFFLLNSLKKYDNSIQVTKKTIN